MYYNVNEVGGNKMRTLVVLFNNFSMQEISCATEIIAITGNKMDTCATCKEPICTEDGFHVMPDYTFDEVCLKEYDCVILPGIAYMFEELKIKAYADFLSQLKEYPEILIASISSSPVFLGAAGLLDGHTYCGGIYNEIIEDLPFMPKEGFVEKACHKDGNIITAIGFAYREFAFMIADHFGLEFDKKYFGPLEKDFSGMQLSWDMDETVRKIWKNDLKDILEVYNCK